MAYPDSTVLSAGDTGLATQYNNLRKDALTKIISVPIFDKDYILITGDWANGVTFCVPAYLDGYEIVAVEGELTGAQSSSGTVTVQVYNITDSVDILSSGISISSSTWRGTGTVNASYKTIQTGDRIRFDVDAAGTGAKGLVVAITAVHP
jgi:hypothetical protein